MYAILKTLIICTFLGYLTKQTLHTTPKLKPKNYKKIRSFNPKRQPHKKYTNQVEAMWDEVNK